MVQREGGDPGGAIAPVHAAGDGEKVCQDAVAAGVDVAGAQELAHHGIGEGDAHGSRLKACVDARRLVGRQGSTASARLWAEKGFPSPREVGRTTDAVEGKDGPSMLLDAQPEKEPEQQLVPYGGHALVSAAPAKAFHVRQPGIDAVAEQRKLLDDQPGRDAPEREIGRIVEACQVGAQVVGALVVASGVATRDEMLQPREDFLLSAAGGRRLRHHGALRRR